MTAGPKKMVILHVTHRKVTERSSIGEKSPPQEEKRIKTAST